MLRRCIITEHSGGSHSLPGVLCLVAIRAGEDCSVCAGATAPLAAAAAAAAAAVVRRGEGRDACMTRAVTGQLLTATAVLI
jgi:hypothetical protein